MGKETPLWAAQDKTKQTQALKHRRTTKEMKQPILPRFVDPGYPGDPMWAALARVSAKKGVQVGRTGWGINDTRGVT